MLKRHNTSVKGTHRNSTNHPVDVSVLIYLLVYNETILLFHNII